MTKRAQLVASIVVSPVLIILFSVVEAAAPKSGPGGLLMAFAMLWTFFGPALFASRYAGELGMPGGIWGLMSIFFPIVTPTLLAGVSRPALPQLSPEMQIQGRPVRAWGLGDPLHVFTTKKFLGTGGKTLVITSKGLIGDDRVTAGGVAWGQVREIYQNLRDQYFNGMHTARIRKYTLVLTDGRKLVVNQDYSDIDQLGPQLQTQVTAALRPKAADMLERGERVSFGPLTLGPSSLSLKGKELPWNEVADVTVNAGYLVVSKRAGSSAGYVARRSVEAAIGLLTRIAGTAQPMLGSGYAVQWRKVSADSVPNVYLLVTLSEAMIEKASAQDSLAAAR